MLYACSFSGVKTPDEYELAGCLGVYFPVVEEEKQIVLNERRVYERGIGLERHEDYGYLEVWWADGYWWMGTSTVRGKPEGILRRKSCSPIPETVHMAWEVCVSLGQALGKAWRKTDIVCSSVPPVAGSVDGDDGGGSGGGDGGDGDGGDGPELTAEQEEEERLGMWNEELAKVKGLLGALTYCTASQHFALIKFIITEFYLQRTLYLSTLLSMLNCISALRLDIIPYHKTLPTENTVSQHFAIILNYISALRLDIIPYHRTLPTENTVSQHFAIILNCISALCLPNILYHSSSFTYRCYSITCLQERRSPSCLTAIAGSGQWEVVFRFLRQATIRPL